MSHTVVRLNAEVEDEMEAERLTSEIKNELEDREYAVADNSVGDGKDLDGDIRLRVNTHLKLPSEADSWSTYLLKLGENDPAFVGGVVDEHDCMHVHDKPEGCKPVKWTFGDY